MITSPPLRRPAGCRARRGRALVWALIGVPLAALLVTAGLVAAPASALAGTSPAGFNQASNRAIAWTGSEVLITAADADGNVYCWWQAAGSSTWHPQTVASASSTAFYKVPTIVWTGSGVGISAAQTGGNLYYWFQPTGSPSWPAPTLLTSNGAPDGLAAPSAAWSGSNVILASIDYLSQADSWQSGSSWSEVPVTTGESDVYSFRRSPGPKETR